MLAATAAIVTALGGLIALWQLWLRWRAHRVNDVREVSDFMANKFGEIYSVEISEFMTEQTRASGRRLNGLIDQVRDGNLRMHLTTLNYWWCCTLDLGELLLQGLLTDSEQTKYLAEVVQKGKRAVAEVEVRCNTLERFIVTR